MFNVKLAGYRFCIENTYEYIEELCREYTVPDSDDSINIKVTEDECNAENKDHGNWSPAYLESLAVYRKICEYLVQYDIFLFHCSALAIEEEGVLLTGESGAGKSTHAGLWREMFGDRLVTVNDDKPLISFSNNTFRVYGTPYGGKDNLQTNTSAEIKAVVEIQKGKENIIKRADRKKALRILLKQVCIPA